MAAAHGGQILMSDATEALVRSQLPDGATLLDLGEHRLRDLERPEEAPLSGTQKLDALRQPIEDRRFHRESCPAD